MARTPNADIPQQEAGSLTTDALFNEFADIVDAWLNCVVLAVGQAAPAGTEVEGDRYIVGTGTGVFAGHDDELAILRGGTWQFHEAQEGVTVHNLDDGADWINEGSGGWALKNAAGDVSSVNGLTGAVTAVTRGKHAVPIMAGAIAPSFAGGCAALATIASAANQPDIVTLDFDPTTQEYAQFAIPMPKSWDKGTITALFNWSHAATTTNFGVVWNIQAVAVSNDDTIAVNFGTAQQVADTGGTTNDLYVTSETPAITVGGSPANGDTVFFRISRVTGDGSDTMAIDARLHSVVLFITTDADTDA